jgi:hypothetical protein
MKLKLFIDLSSLHRGCIHWYVHAIEQFNCGMTYIVYRLNVFCTLKIGGRIIASSTVHFGKLQAKKCSCILDKHATFM